MNTDNLQYTAGYIHEYRQPPILGDGIHECNPSINEISRLFA